MKKEKIIESGKSTIYFDKQIIKINLKRCKKIKELTCDEAYHLWNVLDSVFRTEIIAKRIKVYNLLGEEINLVETLKGQGKISKCLHKNGVFKIEKGGYNAQYKEFDQDMIITYCSDCGKKIKEIKIK